MARPTNLTSAVQEKIVAYLRAGAYVETAVVAAGVGKTQFYDWLKRGAAGEATYVAFAAAVEEAQAQSEMRDLALIGKAAETQWQAAAWRLERRLPQRWGRHERHEVSGPNGGPISVAVLSAADLAAKIDALAVTTRDAAAAPAGDASADPGEAD